MIPRRLSGSLAVLLVGTAFALLADRPALRADDGPKAAVEVDWGSVVRLADGDLEARITRWTAAGAFALPAPAPNVVSCVVSGDPQRRPVPVAVATSGGQVSILAGRRPTSGELSVRLETLERSTQRSDGRIQLSAVDARVEGKAAKLESDPGNHRIGFWTETSDRAVWTHRATRPGTYDLELSFSLADGASKVRVEVGEERREVELAATGSWYRYSVARVGRVKIPKPGDVKVSVEGVSKTGVALLNLKAVLLRPASEGEPITQADDGAITCHARDVTIHGVQVQYEPQPHKNTVGYWTKPKDRVSWEFTVTRPGVFEVEVLQGCGKGAGGSEVEISIGAERVRFTVEDTGHFQNFIERRVGTIRIAEAGAHRVVVEPVSKAGVAVMDLRRLRLLPKAAD